VGPTHALPLVSPPPSTAAEDLRAALRGAWARSDETFSRVSADAIHDRPIALRQPFLFYLGHLPAFAWNQVVRGLLRRPSFAPDLDALFERGIDPVGVDEVPAPDPSAWPSVERTLAYRDRVRAAVLEAVDDALAHDARVVRLVLEHEWMHHETLLYMAQALPGDRKRAPALARAPVPAAAGPSREVEIPEGDARLGVDLEDVPFAWDNEVPETRVRVPAFAIDSLPVRNAEYAEFVRAGGYRRPDLWSQDGFAWRARRGLDRPWSWIQDGAEHRVRTVFREAPWSEAAEWPVQVSWAEADAYARWRGRRLPTEAEVRRAACATPDGDWRDHPWGDAPPAPAHGRFAYGWESPAPVGTHPAGRSAFGVDDLVGGGWEWTSTVFAPFPGFSNWHATYPGYSRDFFDGRHRVLLGASFATPVGLVRPSFRNWFQPHYPHVFAKFRCAR
jgi:ergothioneine biosynthesis protein EgtB